MRALPSDSTILILLPLALFFVRVIGDSDARTSTKFNSLIFNGQKPQLVSFNSKEGDIEVSSVAINIEVFFTCICYIAQFSLQSIQ